MTDPKEVLEHYKYKHAQELEAQLLPCPFCGGGAVFEEYAYHTDGRIICVRCGATSSNEWSDSSGKDWKVKAAEKWNRRANNGSVD